ncbi:MAG: TraR/DksA family transcriptional regulator [Ktedonobacterales bacterium]
MAQFDEAAIRQRLLADLADLEEDIRDRTVGDEAVIPVDPLNESGGLPSDQADDADAMSDSERNQAILRNSVALLNQVSAALARLDAGTYGKCVRCGRDIAPRRLEALPYVTLCIDCQAAVEQHAAR